MFFRDNSHLEEIYRLKKQVASLSDRLHDLEIKLEQEQRSKKALLLRIKNGDDISDDFILNNSPYLDLSPEKARRIYNDQDKDFILLDVSSAQYTPPVNLPEVIKIPLDKLHSEIHRLPGKGKLILVISEDGVRSINACKQLHQYGYYSVSNISGGYQYWIGSQKNTHQDSAA